MTEPDSDNITPPTEPVKKIRGGLGGRKTKKPATADSLTIEVEAPRPQPAKVAGSPAGLDLLPDMNGQNVETELAYWVGVLPACPMSAVHIGGQAFPKINELVRPDPNKGDRKVRIPVIGSIVRLNRDGLERIRKRLRRTVIRFTEEPNGEAMGSGQSLGEESVTPRKGYPITIPTEQDIAERKALNLSTRRYVRGKWDEPIARYLFAVPCENQERPSRQQHYPDSLEQTGLTWPAES